MLHCSKRGNSFRTRGCAWAVALAAILLLPAGAAVAQDAEPPETAAASNTDAAAAEESPVAPSPDAVTGEDLLAEETPAKDRTPDVPDMGEALLKMVVFMLLLLGLLVAGAVVFQRWIRGRVSLGGPKRPLRLVDRLALGPKTGLCLVNVCGRHLVLGIAEKEVTVLLEMPMSQEDEEDADFSGMLSRIESASGVKPTEKDRK